MIIFCALLIVCAPYAVVKLIVARTSNGRAGAPTAPAEPLREAVDNSPRWGALDDRQLTRLLTDSAPRPITE